MQATTMSGTKLEKRYSPSFHEDPNRKQSASKRKRDDVLRLVFFKYKYIYFFWNAWFWRYIFYLFSYCSYFSNSFFLLSMLEFVDLLFLLLLFLWRENHFSCIIENKSFKQNMTKKNGSMFFCSNVPFCQRYLDGIHFSKNRFFFFFQFSLFILYIIVLAHIIRHNVKSFADKTNLEDKSFFIYRTFSCEFQISSTNQTKDKWMPFFHRKAD